MSFNRSFSSNVFSPNVSQYSLPSSQHSQMPSPWLPRFCFSTLGRNAAVFRNPSHSSSLLSYVNVSDRPQDMSRILTSAFFAPIVFCTAGEFHTSFPSAMNRFISASKSSCAPSRTPGHDSCPGLIRTTNASYALSVPAISSMRVGSYSITSHAAPAFTMPLHTPTASYRRPRLSLSALC